MPTYFNYSALGKNFACLRKKCEKSLKNISDETGISIWELLCIEACASPENVSLLTLFRLCDYFNVSLIEIFSLQ